MEINISSKLTVMSNMIETTDTKAFFYTSEHGIEKTVGISNFPEVLNELRNCSCLDSTDNLLTVH